MNDSLEQAVFDTFREICTLNGYESTSVTPSTKPFQDFEGFDSLNAQEFCVILSETVGKEVDFQAAFGDKGTVLTISEVAQRIYEYVYGEAK